jgi:hypothetical protein
LRELDALDSADQEELLRRTRAAADAYLTPGLSRRLTIPNRLRLWLCQHGDATALRNLNAALRTEQTFPLLLREGRLFVMYPGFDEDGGPPPNCFEFTADPNVIARHVRAEATALGWSGTHLTVRVETAVVLDVETPLRARLLPVSGEGAERYAAAELREPTTPACTEASGSALTIQVEGEELVKAGARDGRWKVRLDLGLHDPADRVKVHATTRAASTATVGEGHVRFIARPGKYGGLVVAVRRLSQAPAKPLRRSPMKRLIPWTSA